MNLPLTPAQKNILAHEGSSLIVGPVGSGKTTTLLEKTLALLNATQKVALCTFAYRNLEFLKYHAQGTHPKLTAYVASGQLRAGTLRDLAAHQLQTAGQPFSFISNNQVREVLRAIMAETGFAGTLAEAEHIIRAAKGRAKKLPENDRHFTFVNAYKQKLEELNLLDRHDIIRRHVLGMKEGKVAPLPVKHIVLDNLQDATELQLIWLQMHLNNGVNLSLAADDDITIFAWDGALGLAAQQQVEDWPDIVRFNLPATHRLPQSLCPAITKVARQLRERAAKAEETTSAIAGTFRAEAFPSPMAEHAFLTATVSQALAEARAKNRTPSIGLITRDDFTANLIAHILRKGGLNPACFARLVWENPTPQLILALLYVLLGQGTFAHLIVVLAGFGVPPAVAQGLLPAEATPATWLASGCPLRALEGLSPTLQTQAQKVKRAYSSAVQLMHAKAVPPREVFKGLVEELLTELPAPEHAEALLATDMLLSLTGKLTEVLPRVMTETLPDMESPITVAPVREVRNMEFTTVILPHAGAASWPHPPHELLGPNPDHERRLFYLAISRTVENLLLTWHTPQPTPFLAELQQSFKQQARRGG